MWWLYGDIPGIPVDGMCYSSLFFLSFELTMSLEANVIKSNLIAGKLLLSMNIEAYLF